MITLLKSFTKNNYKQAEEECNKWLEENGKTVENIRFLPHLSEETNVTISFSYNTKRFS